MAAAKIPKKKKSEIIKIKFFITWICPTCGSKTSSELTRREYLLRFMKRNTEHNITYGLCGDPKMVLQDIPDFLIDGTG